MHYVDLSGIFAVLMSSVLNGSFALQCFAARMSPTVNGSFALQCFKRGKAVKLHNGIMFNFYLGLPHIFLCVHFSLFIKLAKIRISAHSENSV